jgi:hypothetical protein
MSDDSPPAPWRGTVNGILYGLIFVPELNEAAADTMARAMLQRRAWGNNPEEFAEAIPLALAHPGPIADGIPTHHTEEQFRAYLAMLGEKLESLRPWD